MITANNTTFKDFIRIWFYWRKHALASFVFLFVSIMAFAYLYTPVYESTAKVMVLPSTAEGAVVSTGATERKVLPASAEILNSEIEIILSNDVMRQTIASFFEQGEAVSLRVETNAWYKVAIGKVVNKIKEFLIFIKLMDPKTQFDSYVSLLEDSITVEPVSGSNIILLSLVAESPKAAAVVLNRLIQVYIGNHNQIYTNSHGADYFAERAVVYRGKIDSLNDRLTQVQQSSNIIDLEAQNENNAQLLTKLDEEVKGIDVDLAQSRSMISSIEKIVAAPDQEFLLPSKYRDIPSLHELSKALIPLTIRYSELSGSVSEGSRELKDLKQQINFIQQARIREVQSLISAEKAELRALMVRRQTILNNMDSIRRESIVQNNKWSELNSLKKMNEINQQNLMFYQARKESASDIQDMNLRQISSVAIADIADVPVEKKFPKRLIMLVLALFAGFFVALCLPFALEFLDLRIKTVSDLKDLVDCPVVAVVDLETK